MKLSVKIFLGFTLVIVLSCIDSVINYKLSQEVNRNTIFLTNSELIIRNSNRLQRGIIEMQSSFRGFLLTDNPNFLTPYYDEIKYLPILFEEQKKLVDAQSQKQRLNAILDIHEDWIQYANSLIRAKQDTILIAAGINLYSNLFKRKLQKEVGKKMNDKISDYFKEFDKFEYKVRQERRESLNQAIEKTHTFSLILSICTITIAIISCIYITHLISKRIKSMVEMAEKISKGNFQKIEDNQNDELSDLSRSLNVMSETLDKNISDLEKKNKELDQFAYVVSHDLKAPLRGMFNISTWIEEDLGNELSEQHKRYHELLKGRAIRMKSLINGLLEYAKIGRVKNNLEDVNVHELVEDIHEMIVPEGFKLEVATELPTIKTERLRIEQVFTNLISNAIKHNPKQNGNIRLNCEELPEHYQFSVSDDGIGIEAEYHEKIFAIFQTLREKHEVESTGVGLAIVKKIIEEQKGTLQLQSEVGKGSTFSFTWPKKPAEIV